MRGMTSTQPTRKSSSRSSRSASSSTTSPQKRGPQSHLGIAANDRRHVCDALAALLADQHVLYQKTRLCHWNLVGGRFDPLHMMFEGQYEALAKSIDATAERIRMLDGTAPGSLRELQKSARLSEIDGRLVDGTTALELLLTDHEACVVTLRADIERIEDEFGDVGTADLLTGLLRDHEKTAWMLRSHLATDGGSEAGDPDDQE